MNIHCPNQNLDKTIPPGLCGRPTESVIFIDGVKTTALLDTGSTVSTVSWTFYDQHLKHIPLEPLEKIINIECADGNSLLYHGYIETAIQLKETDSTFPCIFLIIPDSQYHSTVPVLLGTNILSVIMENYKDRFGIRFLQTADLTTPWYSSFRCIQLREKELRKTNNRLSLVKSAEHLKTIVPPNTNVTIQAMTTKEIPYHLTPAMTHPTESSFIPTDLDIEPSIIDYRYQQNGLFHVKVSNITTRTVTIPPNAIICELQPVLIQDSPIDKDKEFSPPLLEKIEISTGNLSSTEFQLGKDFIMSYQDIFSKDDYDIGHVTSVKHRIELEDERPFKQRYRHIPPAMYEDVKSHLHQMLRAGVIRKSHSPYASNIVLVKKKNGSLRICVDYRQLNLKTKKDAYALPRTEDMLDCMAGNKYFSTVDMRSGFHQVEILEEHKERTAFTVGPLGLFEYNRMPFGLACAPATYQRLMQDCLADLHMSICCVFIDDIIIFGHTYEEHMERLKMVFDRIREANLKLSPSKCSFFKPRVKFVGHIVSEAGVETDPEKVDKVSNWPTPKTPEDVRKFIGFVGYYRRFIDNFSQIAKPLTSLMPSPTTKKGKKKKKHEQRPWEWSDKQETAFTTLKQRLISAPILGYADYAKPFELHTDASGQGLGAVLYQEQAGTLRVIAYASRGLTKAEQNYPAHKMEFLALKWSITDKFHDYLYGHTFKVLTDNNPLTYVLTTAKLDATGHRWLAALATYDFEIHYRPGKSNADADSLSRLATIDQKSIKAICGSMQTPLVEAYAISPDAVNSSELDMHMDVSTDINWSEAQAKDPSLHHCIKLLKAGQTPKKGQTPSTPIQKQFSHLRLIDDVLYREVAVDGQQHHQLVLPASYIKIVMEALHDEIGHPGKDRTISLIRERFYWPGLYKDVENRIHRCERCIKRKKEPEKAPLVNITTTQPMELICIDYLTLEPSKGGIQDILVITDHFTRYAQAIPTRNQTARTTAEALFNNFIVHYGIPGRIHSDQGPSFESKLIQELCHLTGIRKSRTTPYHPMGNGLTERFNRTLISMLGTLQPRQKTNWKAYVAPLVHAYNCTQHNATGHSPYFLMFGRHPRLPIDLAFGLVKEKDRQPQSVYIQELKERLVQAYQLASESAKKAKDKQKAYYDLKCRGATIEKGDKVLVKRVAFEGKHKLTDKWEEDTYIVLEQPNEAIPVYVVQKENREGRKRTLHRNLLLPVGYLHRNQQEEKPITVPPKPVPRPRTRASKKKQPTTANDSTTEESDNDESVDLVFPRRNVVNTRPSVVIDTGSQEYLPVEQQPEPDGDAHSVEAREDMYGSEGSASDMQQDDDEQEELIPGGDTDTHSASPDDDDVEVSPVVPRRSVRARTQPHWLKSGDYVTKSAVPPDIPVIQSAEWKQKADVIYSFADKGLFTGIESEAGKALLIILTEHH